MSEDVQVLRHVEGVSLVQHGTQARLIAPGHRPVLALDATAFALWELCDGETTVAEMTDAVCALVDAPPSTVERDIRQALAAMVHAQLLEWTAIVDVPRREDGPQ